MMEKNERLMSLMKETYLTSSERETEALGERMAARLAGISVAALYGELGAGKTALTRGIARGLGCRDSVSSPTYTVVNEYRGGARRVCHFDMYRLSGADELYDIGWEDYLASGCLCVVEWGQIAEAAFPPDTAYIRITKTGENMREITLEC